MNVQIQLHRRIIVARGGPMGSWWSCNGGGLHMATYLSIAMTTSNIISLPPMRCIKNIWEYHPQQRMVFHSWRKSTVILGVAKEARIISMEERLISRKYIGVWSHESKVTVTRMRRFPSTITTQTTENPRQNKIWRFWDLESPSTMNSNTTEWFALSILSTLSHISKWKNAQHF